MMLSEYLEAVGTQIGQNWLKLNCYKTEWVFIPGTGDSGYFHLKVLNGVAFFPLGLVQNLEGFLDLQPLLKELVAAVAK